MRQLIMRGLAASTIVAAASPAIGQITTFNNRVTFTTAASPVVVEGFQSYAADTSFRLAPVDVGPFSLRLVGSTSAFASNNFIDVPPNALAETNVNGTTHLNVFTNAGSSFFIDFDAPTNAFGFDFYNFNDGSQRTLIFVNGVQITPSITTANTGGFFGFTSVTAFTTVEFRGIDNDVFGLDNITFNAGAGAVPEPATWAMMLVGFGGLGFAMRRRPARTRVRFA